MSLRERGRQRLVEMRKHLPNADTDPWTWWIWHITFALTYKHRGKQGSVSYEACMWMLDWYIGAAMTAGAELVERELEEIKETNRLLEEEKRQLEAELAALRGGERSQRDRDD